MKLREALELAKQGGYVKAGRNGCWNEWGIQYFYKDGILYWTAGMTVGGECKDLTDKQLDGNTSWHVFKHFGSDISIMYEDLLSDSDKEFLNARPNRS
jgi:hypothetical protein